MLDNHIRKAIILVGGEGTRLRPLTYTTTKAMMPVLNVPFIERMISYVRSYNISEIILAMGYKPDSISDYFHKSPIKDVTLRYCVEESALGTAGAVKNASRYIDEGESFFVFNGDIFTDLNLNTMAKFHQNVNATITIALTPVDDPSQFGVVERDNGQRIIRFIEKPQGDNITSNCINAGTYIMNTDIFDHIPVNQFCMFEKDVFPQLIAKDGRIYGYNSDAYWIDMGTPRKYLDLNRDLLCGKSKTPNLPQYEEMIGKGSEIHPQASVEGPVLIGTNCSIGKGVVVKGPSVIGTECTISDYAFINGSIIMDRTSVGKHVKVVNSILSNGLTINDGESVENSVMAFDSVACRTVTSQL